MKMKSLVLSISAALAVSCAAVNAENNGKALGEEFSFALVGDTPYGASREPEFDYVIDAINSDREVDWVIHAGDIKAGGERCDDELLTARFEQFQQFDMPFVYSPGDNEWTDCHRTSNGSYLPTERLDYLRSLFFPVPGYTTGGETMAVSTQANQPGFEKYVENTLFIKSGVIFSQIHVVGSNNDLAPWNQVDPNDSYENPRADRLAEFQGRNTASLAWLDETFRIAMESDAPGVFITIHANPGFEVDPSEPGRAGFNDFLASLKLHAKEYGRPVVLAHGDSHIYFTDKPWMDNLTSEIVPYFSRVVTFGSAENHWLKIEVDPKGKEVFRIVPQLVEANF